MKSPTKDTGKVKGWDQILLPHDHKTKYKRPVKTLNKRVYEDGVLLTDFDDCTLR